MFRKKKYELQVKELHISRYTKEAWKRCYPGASMEEWRERVRPENIYEFITDVLCQFVDGRVCDMSVLEQLVITTIDDEYFDWLDKTGCEDTAQNRAVYTEAMSPDDAIRLLRKNHMDIVTHSLCIPVDVFKEDSFSGRASYAMSKETRQALHKYLSSIYNGEVYVAPYYVLPSDLFNESDRLLGLAETFFDERAVVRIGKYEEQRFTSREINLSTFYIPVFLRSKVDTATFVPDWFMDKDGNIDLMTCPDIICFERDAACFGEDNELIFVSSMSEAGVTEKIHQDFSDCDANVYPFPIQIDDIPDFEEDKLGALKSVAKERGVALHAF